MELNVWETLAQVSNKEGDGYIVLSKTETSYATHLKHVEGGMYYGHYFEQTPEGLKSAQADYRIRAGREVKYDNR